jgi:hypothetical protein
MYLYPYKYKEYVLFCNGITIGNEVIICKQKEKPECVTVNIAMLTTKERKSVKIFGISGNKDYLHKERYYNFDPVCVHVC